MARVPNTSQRAQRRVTLPRVPEAPAEEPVPELDGTIALFMDFMAMRRGRDRNTATATEIAHRFRTDVEKVKKVMNVAWARNLVTFYPSGEDVYYVRRSEL